MKQLFFLLALCLQITLLTAQSIKTVTAVRATSFEQATVTLLNDSIFKAWVSVKSNAYDGYINHAVYLKELPADSMAMINVKDIPVLNHTNLKKIEYNNGTVFFFKNCKAAWPIVIFYEEHYWRIKKFYSQVL